ncbi:hypothetical protein [Paracoccus saliphilus]|uniref:Uncharacterized protein n=1 Tax=Paracoccus saliphilus TaxID=405559 RepID=A0AA45W2A6_9RHOB|nr:hypothetical protein [Paracoccus saliphilus]SIS65100.1 hypothetical protein SAMN05421772_102278 [Paracoccus saliphilus]
MSDNRTIRGSIDVDHETVARTAYKMANDLWYREHSSDPKASDEAFLKLVSKCSKALRGLIV